MSVWKFRSRRMANSISKIPLLHHSYSTNGVRPSLCSRTDWQLDATRAAADAQVVRTPMPAKWDWPLAAPMKLKTKASDGTPLELVPYGCAKLRISMFSDTTK